MGQDHRRAPSLPAELRSATEAVDGLPPCRQFDCLAASVSKPRIVGVTSGGQLRVSVGFPGVLFSLNEPALGGGRAQEF